VAKKAVTKKAPRKTAAKVVKKTGKLAKSKAPTKKKAGSRKR
jgi:hypothetical protein